MTDLKRVTAMKLPAFSSPLPCPEPIVGRWAVLMIATALHSIAVGNLLPSWIKAVCVDINPSTAIKLADRGSFQTINLVTDVAPFLRALVEEIQVAEASMA
jgi:hypothetical protein